MQLDTRRLVIVPRFSSLVGAGTYTTKPLRIREFSQADITVWRGDAMGTTPTFVVEAEQSNDLNLWFGITDFEPDANEEQIETALFTMDWMRLSIYLGGTDPILNYWAVGEFQVRSAVRA